MKPILTSIFAFACAVAMLAALTMVVSAHAGEIGHYNGGVMNIRDYVLPDPGFYGVVYNYFYTTNRINDPQGNTIKSVTIKPGPGPGITLGVKVHVDMYALAPTIMWVTDIKPLGIKYGALITPSFVNANLDAALWTVRGRGVSTSSGSFGIGDLFVQPIWIGKATPHLDFALGYGFYAPVGKYNTDTVALPVSGKVTVEPSDNLGYGFWTHQIQGAAAWYPWTDKRTAVVTALTYEKNSRKRDFALTPGDNLTFNWGISQNLPLKNDMSLLLEFGPAGYDTWQITNDSGSAATKTRDQVHAVGGQLGVTYVPWMTALTFHGFYEFAAKDRFQGGSFGVNIGKKF